MQIESKGAIDAVCGVQLRRVWSFDFITLCFCLSPFLNSEPFQTGQSHNSKLASEHVLIQSQKLPFSGSQVTSGCRRVQCPSQFRGEPLTLTLGLHLKNGMPENEVWDQGKPSVCKVQPASAGLCGALARHASEPPNDTRT